MHKYLILFAFKQKNRKKKILRIFHENFFRFIGKTKKAIDKFLQLID